MKKYSLIEEVGRCRRAAPGAFYANAAIGIVSALMPTAQLLAFSRFIDGALAGHGYVLPLAVVALLIGFRLVSGKVSRYLDDAITLRLREIVEPEVLRLSASVEFGQMEDADARDLAARATEDVPAKAVNAYRLLLRALELASRMLGVVLVIFFASPRAAMLVVILAAPFIALAARAGRETHRAKAETTADRRRYEALFSVLTGREQAADRMLFRYAGKVLRMYRERYGAYKKVEVRAGRRNTFALEMGSIVTCAVVVGIVALLIAPLSSGLMSAGLFISLVAAAFELIEIMSWDFTGLISALVLDAHDRRDFAAFLDLPATEDALALPDRDAAFESLEFKDVTFKYPGTDRLILDGVSFKLERGERYALVGLNGAGKTTIVKLMMGLYGEYGGEILLNGRPLKACGHAYISGCLSAVYQDFARYQITLSENVAVGDIAHFDSAARAVETDGISEEIGGYGVRLGRISEGAKDISGGQWQRVAIARGTRKERSLMVLDEPTAALDPLAESRVYEDFARAQHGRTALLISHRLGSTKLADTIFVLSGGRVEAAGRHDQLMEECPLYRQMYQGQRRWYL